MRTGGPVLLAIGVAVLLAPPAARAQQCLGRPVESGAQAVAARVALDRGMAF